MRSRFAPLLVVFALFVLPRAARADDTDKTLSPYFFVEGADPSVDALPLQKTTADVHISGVIADVVVKQTYRNSGTKTLSARYVFPASTRAAVYGMEMTIGTRRIVAKIKERDAARKEYEEAKAAGKTASLLEQDRPNVFTMNVANILPNDVVDVELHYTELLVPTDGMYELVYPTVVGPRYASEGKESTTASPYLHAGQAPTSAFDIHVSIAAGMKIQEVSSPSHSITKQLDAMNATVALGAGELANRDFVLRYRLASDDIGTGLVTFKGANENFFLMMVQPPRRPAPEMIPPREYVFIIDVSGSMHGFPLDTTKAVMRDLLGRLRKTDRFNVLLFSGGSALYADASVEATDDKVSDAIAFIERETGSGGTELLPALERAMNLPRAAKDVSRSFVVVTDGFISEETAMFDHIRKHLGDANVFSFGIGSSVNRHLTDGIAKAGQGEPFVILDQSQAKVAATKFREYVETPVLTQVKVAFDGFDAYDVQPQVLPDVFANRPVVVFGKYRGAATGSIQLSGVSGRGRFVTKLDASAAQPDTKNAALSYLWARAKISELSDFTLGDENQTEVTKLGLQYSLLTKYTSFIAVQQLVRTTGGSVDVDQPQAMPAGVEDSALGMEVGPEPGLPILLGLVGLGMILWQRRQRRSAA